MREILAILMSAVVIIIVTAVAAGIAGIASSEASKLEDIKAREGLTTPEENNEETQTESEGQGTDNGNDDQIDKLEFNVRRAGVQGSIQGNNIEPLAVHHRQENLIAVKGEGGDYLIDEMWLHKVRFTENLKTDGGTAITTDGTEDDKEYRIIDKQETDHKQCTRRGSDSVSYNCYIDGTFSFRKAVTTNPENIGYVAVSKAGLDQNRDGEPGEQGFFNISDVVLAPSQDHNPVNTFEYYGISERTSIKGPSTRSIEIGEFDGSGVAEKTFSINVVLESGSSSAYSIDTITIYDTGDRAGEKIKTKDCTGSTEAHDCTLEFTHEYSVEEAPESRELTHSVVVSYRDLPTRTYQLPFTVSLPERQ